MVKEGSTAVVEHTSPPVASGSTAKLMAVDEKFGLGEKPYMVALSSLETWWSAEKVDGHWTELTRCARFRLQRHSAAISTPLPERFPHHVNLEAKHG